MLFGLRVGRPASTATRRPRCELRGQWIRSCSSPADRHPTRGAPRTALASGFAPRGAGGSCRFCRPRSVRHRVRPDRAPFPSARPGSSSRSRGSRRSRSGAALRPVDWLAPTVGAAVHQAPCEVGVEGCRGDVQGGIAAVHVVSDLLKEVVVGGLPGGPGGDPSDPELRALRRGAARRSVRSPRAIARANAIRDRVVVHRLKLSAASRARDASTLAQQGRAAAHTARRSEERTHGRVGCGVRAVLTARRSSGSS